MSFFGPQCLGLVRLFLSTRKLRVGMLIGRRKRQRVIATPRQSEGLESRLLLTHVAGMGDDQQNFHAVFAPDTPQSIVDEYEAAHAHAGADLVGFAAFNADDRWFTTATNGSGIALGDAITLTWSIAPDGTNIPGFNGEAAASSDLVSRFRSIYGDTADPSDTDYLGEAWFVQIEAALNEWSDLSGITYIYEANDDGAAFSSSSSSAPGVLGIRGDVRIGGHLIDGNGGVLAYNFFPDNSEMVIDTADSFYGNLGSNSLRLRNVIAHEAGHGIGFNHVESNNAAFLMEPFVSTSFDGPQLDDILAAHRNFGDANEKGGGNDSVSSATNLGSIGNGITVSIGTQANDTRVEAADTDFVSIDDDSDIDVFSFTVSANSSIGVILTPQGPTYNQGQQGGSQSSYNASSQSNLAFEILGTDGTTVLTAAAANGIGSSESLAAFDLNTAGTYFVRITGANNAVQMYQLDVSVTVEAPTSTVSISANDGALAEGDSGITSFTYTVTRTGDVSALATIDYVTAGIGTDPANAADFGGILPSGTVTFDPGVLTQTFTVGVSGDVDLEVLEAFSVTLVNPSAGLQIGTASATGTIINDDARIDISLVAESTDKAEGNTGTTSFTFLVTRMGMTTGTSSVSYSVAGSGANSANANDFGGLLPAGTVTFAAGETQQTITITVSGDSEFEADEGFTVILSNAVGAEIVGATANGTIRNDDVEPETFDITADSASRNEGAGAFTFTVTRSGNVSAAGSVSYTVSGSGSNAANADDFGGSFPSGTVTFAAGATSATVTVNVSDDADVEANESFTVSLDTAGSPSANGTIINDDASGSGVSLVNGVLMITGDGGDDYVWAQGKGKTISVYTYSFTNGTYTWNVFRQSDVVTISVNTGDGNDQVYFTGRINQSATIDLGAGDDVASSGRGNDVILGGAGNDAIYGNNGDDNIDGGDGDDYIRGGNGNDIIRGGNGSNWSYGDNGHDILIGGDNYDYLNGGNGRDILIGGGGSDWLEGGNADDILIGGSTVYDNDDDALSAIRNEWTQRTGYRSRINTIQTGGGSLGNIKLEAGTTVLDDGVTDYLIGDRGNDWYFGDSTGVDRDRIFLSFREVIDQLP
ncbi:MAG: matrixin family metalloprotease [Planctomycetota bacterium]|nr:matrixin family metalloprotease [Planctomycetota bacterium]MDA1164537.1 matrixin family metalloprotease [Planctomycetota bacterium]